MRMTVNLEGNDAAAPQRGLPDENEGFRGSDRFEKARTRQNEFHEEVLREEDKTPHFRAATAAATLPEMVDVSCDPRHVALLFAPTGQSSSSSGTSEEDRNEDWNRLVNARQTVEYSERKKRVTTRKMIRAWSESSRSTRSLPSAGTAMRLNSMMCLASGLENNWIRSVTQIAEKEDRSTWSTASSTLSPAAKSVGPRQDRRPSPPNGFV